MFPASHLLITIYHSNSTSGFFFFFGGGGGGGGWTELIQILIWIRTQSS